jgi:hypothetical protein
MTTDIGPQRVGDPRGWLLFDHLPDDLARAEDQTLAADHQRILENLGMFDAFDRAATDAEQTLLAHLGYTLSPALTTSVTWLSNGVRNRRWTTLEGN